VDDYAVKLMLGAVIIAFSIYSLTAGNARHLTHTHVGWLMTCGFFAGILGGAYGMNGPPLVVYGALRRWSPQQFRATLQGYFLPVSFVGLIAYGLIGLWDRAIAEYFVWSLPGIAAATVLGRSINHRMESDRFFRVVYGGLALIGAALVVQATKR
jgi:uncharacterized membrane protein YfcA